MFLGFVMMILSLSSRPGPTVYYYCLHAWHEISCQKRSPASYLLGLFYPCFIKSLYFKLRFIFLS